MKILLSLISAFCVITLHAQDPDEGWNLNPNLHLGVKGGLSISNILSEELDHKSAKPGMVVGLSCSYLKAKRYLWKVELNGCLKGANFSYDSAASLKRLSFFYLDMPLMFHVRVDKGNKFWPFIGVQPSLIMRKDAYKSDELVPIPVVTNIKDVDVGAIAGLMYQINESVGIQIMFQYGLTNFNNKLTLPFYPYLGKGLPMYNRSLQLSLVF